MSSTRTMLAGLLAVAASSSVASCVTSPIEGRARFVEDNVAALAPANWKGEKVVIDLDGAATAPLGTLEILIDPAIMRVRAVARMVAIADAEDKASADQSIDAAKKSFGITTVADTTTVTCREGTTSGSSMALDSGCETLSVFVPSGNVVQPLVLAAYARRGRIVVTAIGDATLRDLDLRAGAGTIAATVPASAGARIAIVAEAAGDVTLKLPVDFAADALTLSAAPGKLDTSAFPDVRTGAGRGPAGAGARLIELASRESGGTTGTVTLTKQ